MFVVGVVFFTILGIVGVVLLVNGIKTAHREIREEDKEKARREKGNV